VNNILARKYFFGAVDRLPLLIAREKRVRRVFAHQKQRPPGKSGPHLIWSEKVSFGKLQGKFFVSHQATSSLVICHGPTALCGVPTFKHFHGLIRKADLDNCVFQDDLKQA
jgi:hypothetical protein